MVYTSCNGCQWEDTCQFSCPCEDYCGIGETDNEIDYTVSLFECIEEYMEVVNDCRE